MKLRYKVISIVLGVLCTICIVPNIPRRETKSDMIFITAAHIPHEQMVGYTFMYEDPTRDTAYYLKNDYVYSYPKIGSIVYFGNTKGTVVSIKDGVGFYVEPSNGSKIYKGMSGSRVRNGKGDDIGFISSAKNTDKILCISIR